MRSSQDFPEFDPQNPNKNRCTPDCAHIQLSTIDTMSSLLNHFVYANNLEEEQQFSIVIDDCQVDSFQSTEIIDLGIGIGAHYVLIKGCQKNEKLYKINRFVQIKSI